MRAFLIAAGIAVALFMSGGAKPEGIVSGCVIGGTEGIYNCLVSSAPVTPAPTVTAVSPNSGTFAGGTAVTITGTNFTGMTATNFGVSNPGTCSVSNSTTILCTSPPGSPATIDVTVTTPGGTSAISAADHYTYINCCVTDGRTAGIKADYSSRLLLSTYAGSAIQVTRLSDSTTLNIGFVVFELDAASLTTFCAGTTCRVTTWYDQSGGGNNLTNGTFATAPIIYTAGTIEAINTKPALFLSNGPFLANTSLSSIPASTLYQNSVASCTLTQNSAITGTSASGGLEWRVQQTTGKLELLKEFVVSIGTSTSAISANTGAIVESFYNSSTGAFSFFINRTAAGSGTQTETMTASTLFFGKADTAGNDPATCTFGEYIAYDQAGGISSPNQAAITANQHTYWGTP